MKDKLWEIMDFMSERYVKLKEENDVANATEIIFIQRVGAKLLEIIESEEV